MKYRNDLSWSRVTLRSSEIPFHGVIIIDFIGNINANSHNKCERDSFSTSNMIKIIVDTL